MKIMVFDVPAVSGGALSILEEFYGEVKAYGDKRIQWLFVLSNPLLQETENIKVLRFPWIKNSWLHRLFFDQVFAPNIVKKYQPDRIFSMQNVIVPRTRTEQIIYVHQSLPFTNYKFSFRENRLFWIYQNILSKAIYKSIKSAKKIIVQTNWFKDACIERTGVNANKIKVVHPKININVNKRFTINRGSCSTFFYPSGAAYYKNHRLIVNACKIMKENNVNGYKVIFTLKGNESDHIDNLYREVKENNLPIDFIGSINREEVFHYYTKAVLVFPSYIETFGLPMLESKLHKGLVLAADTPFSHEILDGYENAHFFNSFNSEELADLMKGVIRGDINYVENISEKTESEVQRVSLIDEILLN